MRELVSIIVPCYNAEKYIEKCLNSIIKQTYKKIEIIAINDGSTDKTIDILEKYKEKYDLINIIDRENKGVQYSRKEGIENANGEYVFFVDSDDWIEENTIYDMWNYAEKYNADVVKGRYIKELKNIKIASKKLIHKEKRLITKNDFKKIIYPQIMRNYNFCNIWGQLIRKEAINIKSINTELKYAEDFELNLKIINNCKKIVLLNKAYYHYIINSNSAIYTQNEEKNIKRIKDTIYVYSKLFYYLKIWNIETNANQNIIANRLLKEVSGTLKNLYKNKSINDSEKKKIYNNTIENPKIQMAIKILNKKNKYVKVLSDEKKIKRYSNKTSIYQYIKNLIKNINEI